VVPTSIAALVILLLAIAPGYVAVATWARARTWKGPSGDLRTILQALVLSAIVQAIVLPLTVVWILPIRSSWEHYPGRLAVWAVGTVIVLPLILGIAGARLYDIVFATDEQRNTGWRARVDRLVGAAIAPTVWDTVFPGRVPPSGFLVLEFTDGRRVGGVFASESIVQTSPEPHGLFLEREWVIADDGSVWYEVPATQGLLIPTTEGIRTVRILGRGEVPGGTTDDRNGDGTQDG